jgi:hypothetical protein
MMDLLHLFLDVHVAVKLLLEHFFIAHISILSKAHGAWPLFWPVLRRCHILRWDWSVLPLGPSFHFPFWELWCMLVSVCFHNLVTYAQRLQDLYSACLMFWMRTHTEGIQSSKNKDNMKLKRSM